MGLIHTVVDFGEIQIVATSVACAELTRAGIDPDPLLEGEIEDLDDGVASGEEDFEIVAGLI